MIKKIDHIVITTDDGKRCISFYEKIGFTAKTSGGRYELFGRDFKINVHVKGNEFLPHAKNITVGSADLCFEITGDIDIFKKQLEDKNIEIESGVVARDGVNGNMESIYVRDYDGNLVEFCSYK